MISEIEIGKSYRIKGMKDYTRTPLFVHQPYVFYEYTVVQDTGCGFCTIDDFKTYSEEIPEAPEEWFEVFYRLKNGFGNPHPTLASHLYSSKADFLNCYKREETAFEFIKLRKVEL